MVEKNDVKIITEEISNNFTEIIKEAALDRRWDNTQEITQETMAAHKNSHVTMEGDGNTNKMLDLRKQE